MGCCNFSGYLLNDLMALDKIQYKLANCSIYVNNQAYSTSKKKSSERVHVFRGFWRKLLESDFRDLPLNDF